VLILHNAQHRLHAARHEMYRGRLVDCHETPERLEQVLRALCNIDNSGNRGIGEVREAGALDDAGHALLRRIHAPAYLDFLAQAWRDWLALDPSNAALDILPSVWPGHGLRRDVAPSNFSARVGQYSFDAGTPITAGTWEAALAGAACAIEAARAVSGGAPSAMALTRPPGHHAGADFYGGYCFLNNTALAAQTLRDAGAARVAVIDVDYHHGNGTQAIFYERADVFTASLHGDPRTEYPFYLGYADELGQGAGRGANLNIPLPRGTAFDTWLAALQQLLDAARAFGADALVVALGVDTFEGDPISGFQLRTSDFPRVGELLASLALPTVFVMEGGYATAALGDNVSGVLGGFVAAHG
jgi:acetoin utilization deacetylase AcuC-like enzyme